MGSVIEQNKTLDNYPEALLAYTKTDEKTLVSELEATVSALREGTDVPANGFSEAVAQACIHAVGPVLDQYGTEFFLSSEKVRHEQLSGIFGDSHLGRALKHVLATQNLHTINTHIERFVRSVLGSEPVRVQLATDIEPAQKQRMRADLGKTHDAAFVTFRIDATLLGGMRLFANGEMHDMSWLTRVKRLLSA